MQGRIIEVTVCLGICVTYMTYKRNISESGINRVNSYSQLVFYPGALTELKQPDFLSCSFHQHAL